MSRPSPRLAPLTVLAFLLLTLPSAPPTRAAHSAGRFDLEAGSLSHPVGLSWESAAPYLHGALSYELAVDAGPSRWEFSYQGDLTVFDESVGLGYDRHALGVEYVRPPRAAGGSGWSAGLQGAIRVQDPVLAAYDHTEVFGYLAGKTYIHPRVMLRGVAGLRTRTYDALPEESYTEPHALVELKHFSENRTTLGATVRLGGKWYHDAVAPRVWGTRTTPVTSQLSAGLDVARGLSDRVGLRASVLARIGLDSFPYYVADDIYDSPLLDRYASNGLGASGEIKILTPSTLWLRLGAGIREDDFGDILFADGIGGGAQRRDTSLDLWIAADRRLDWAGRSLTLKGHVGWTDQSSTLDVYTWSGLTAGGGLQWRW
jgi:hypothetical protein